MKAMSRNLKTTKSADKSKEILDMEERERRDLERDRNGFRDQARDIRVLILLEIHNYHFE